MFLEFILASVLCSLIYVVIRAFSNSKKDFWKKHGVHEIDISSKVTSFDLITGRKSQIDGDDFIYKKLGDAGKFCGFVEQGNPCILIKDLDLLRKVLIKDFDHFVDRRVLFGESDGCMEKMLFNLHGEEWKGVRNIMSPTFTTGKIRRMMEYFNEIGKEWVDELKKKAMEGEEGVKIDVSKSVNQFAVDVIASAGFGIKTGTIQNPNSEFSRHANNLGTVGRLTTFKFMVRFQFPWLSDLLGLSLFDRAAMNYFEELLAHGMDQRMRGEVKRNDFVQLLVETKKGELRSMGSDELSTFEKEAQIKVAEGSEKPKEYWLTDKVMRAQMLTFFLAGFSSTMTSVTFALYALAVHEDVQDRLREEVEKIAKEDGTFDYDDLIRLSYLDMVFTEVLRYFSFALRQERMCVKEYRDPSIGLVIPKGAIVVIPVNSIHHDPKYYDNPNNFDPEHFSPEKKAARSTYAYLPFGHGPRNCIGMRFALVEGMTAIAHMVHNFKIEPTEKTPIPMRGKIEAMQRVPPPGLELKLRPIR